MNLILDLRVFREAQLNIWTNLYPPPSLGLVQPSLILGTVPCLCSYLPLFSLSVFNFTIPESSGPPFEMGHRQTETERGWEIERSCYLLLHKASVLPLTVDGLLCSSLQPMASTLYYIYCPLFSCPFPSLLFLCIQGDGKKDRGSWGRGASGGRSRWRFDTVRQD